MQNFSGEKNGDRLYPNKSLEVMIEIIRYL